MSAAVFPFLLAYAAKATLVLAAAALMAALLRRAAAETRALIWSAAIAGVLLLAPAHLLLPRWSPGRPWCRPSHWCCRRTAAAAP
ncbi:MAG TPA: hypothetical protein VHG93_11965, partial [Longimicrobium sp.]|nr:hypothetical protein [Longimicrobium sp.]